MNNSGTNTTLLVIVLLILVLGGFWWYQKYGTNGADQTPQNGIDIEVVSEESPE